MFLALAAAGGMSDKAPKQVDVDGRAFLVEVKKDQAFVTPRYAIMRERMDAAGVKLSRQAAEKASGCKAVSARPTASGLVAKLDCTGETPPVQ